VAVRAAERMSLRPPSVRRTWYSPVTHSRFLQSEEWLQEYRPTPFQLIFMKSASLTRNPRVVHSRLAEGETILLHLETGQYHELNPVGAVIWELLDGQRSSLAIAAEIRARVEDPPADLEDIVIDFMERLRQRGLIT
jgi:hypothetical protein